MTILAQNLAFLRKEKGYKQSDIQEITGIKRNTWSNWENNLTEPSLSNLITISRLFEVSLHDLALFDFQKSKVMVKTPIQEKHPFHDQKGKVKGKVMGKVTNENAVVNEPKSNYVKLPSMSPDSSHLEALVATQNKLISSLEAQISLLEDSLAMHKKKD